MRFRLEFVLGSYVLRFVQNGTKTCHSTAKTLIFMTMRKLRLYTQYLMHNGVPKLDELFFEHLVCGVKYIRSCNV